MTGSSKKKKKIIKWLYYRRPTAAAGRIYIMYLFTFHPLWDVCGFLSAVGGENTLLLKISMNKYIVKLRNKSKTITILADTRHIFSNFDREMASFDRVVVIFFLGICPDLIFWLVGWSFSADFYDFSLLK